MSYTFFEEKPFEERYNIKPPAPDSNKIFVKNLIIIALSVCLAFFAFLSSIRGNEISELESELETVRDEAYREGYNEGEQSGHDIGYENGYVAGCKDVEAATESLVSKGLYYEGIADEHFFFRTSVCIVTTTGEKYHHHGCYHIEDQPYWVYNIELAEAKGYLPCLDCWNSGLAKLVLEAPE